MPERENRVATAMPLFQLFTTERSKLDTNPTASPVDPSPAPESDYVELVWENGQILAQGQSQSNRARRSGFHPSVSQPSNWSEDEYRQKTGKLRGLDFGLGELSAPPSGEISLGQDDDVVPWLNYPFNCSLQSDDFCSDLLPELPGIAGFADGGQPLLCKNSDSMRLLENTIGGEVIVARTGPTLPSHLNPSSLVLQQQPRLNFSPFRSRFLEDAGKVKVMATEDQGKADQGSAFSSFPCFSRPASLFEPDTDDPKASVLDRVDPVDLNFAGSSGVKQSENKQDVGTIIVEVSDVLRDRNEAENDKVGGRTGCREIKAGGIAAKGENNMDLRASSFCSGNTVERDGCDPKVWLKRKSRDNDESDAPSESTERGRGEQLQDVDEEPVRVKKQVPLSSRGTASKRSRAAEVHNLSERRRRDRINEKMRTLQELIPNCNKADKASMLDEAIEYLKMLQLQVQMMTMGAGLYMPPMMLPTGIHNMPHSPHMGLGMGPWIDYGGMGLNVGNSVMHRPVVHIPPPVHGGPFPAMHHGMLPGAFGYTGQGLPMSIPRTPFHPLSATSVVASVTSGYGMAPTTTVLSSKETGPRITTPTNTNSSCRGDPPPTQSGQMRNSSETSDANAADSGGPAIACHGM